MASSIIFATALLLVLNSSVEGQGGWKGPQETEEWPPGQGNPPRGPGKSPPGGPHSGGPHSGGPHPAGPSQPPGQCYAHPHEIKCMHIHLELILRVSVSEYVSRSPELTSQAPWFDSFKHVSIPEGAFTETCLSLLSNLDIRESLTYCVKSYEHGNKTRYYIPPSPVQMYKDMCAENAAIQSQIQ